MWPIVFRRESRAGGRVYYEEKEAMQIRDIMRKDVVTVTAQDSVAKAAKQMQQANVGCIVVTNSGSVRGILTDRDIAVSCLGEGHNALQCQVGNHMSNPVITATPTMDVLEATHIMVERKVKRLPVVEGNQLVGLVSFSDVAQAMERPMHDLLLGMGAARRTAARA